MTHLLTMYYSKLFFHSREKSAPLNIVITTVDTDKHMYAMQPKRVDTNKDLLIKGVMYNYTLD